MNHSEDCGMVRHFGDRLRDRGERRRWCAPSIVGIGLALLLTEPLQAQDSKPENRKSPDPPRDEVVENEVPVYVPPSRGAPRSTV